MPNTPQTGEDTVVLWEPDGGSEIELSTYGRDLELEEEAEVLDSTTYAEAQDGYEASLPGLVATDITMQIMYQRGDAATNNAVAPRTRGTLTIRSEGTGTGKPQYVVSAFVRGATTPHPYNELMIREVTFKPMGAPDRTPQA